MTGTLAEFRQLTDAEQYFEFFEMPYDAQLVNVNRLHILKKLSQYMREIDERSPDLSEVDRLSQYQAALGQAYEVFTTSNALEQKLFKVFHDKPANVVMLKEIS